GGLAIESFRRGPIGLILIELEACQGIEISSGTQAARAAGALEHVEGLEIKGLGPRRLARGGINDAQLKETGRVGHAPARLVDVERLLQEGFGPGIIAKGRVNNGQAVQGVGASGIFLAQGLFANIEGAFVKLSRL